MLESLQIDILPDSNEEYLFTLLHQNFFQGAAIMFCKELTKTALPFPDETKVHDWYLALAAARTGGVKYDARPVLRYRQHARNVIGGEKFSVWKKIAKSKNLKKPSDSKNSTTAFLESFRSRYGECKEADFALQYFENLGKKRFCTIPYFCKNYIGIYRNKRIGLFLLRLAKRILGR